jgi:hypothetical protein
LDYDSHAVGLDRNEVGALLVAAGLSTAAEPPGLTHAMVGVRSVVMAQVGLDGWFGGVLA